MIIICTDTNRAGIADFDYFLNNKASCDFSSVEYSTSFIPITIAPPTFYTLSHVSLLLDDVVSEMAFSMIKSF